MVSCFQKRVIWPQSAWSVTVARIKCHDFLHSQSTSSFWVKSFILFSSPNLHLLVITNSMKKIQDSNRNDCQSGWAWVGSNILDSCILNLLLRSNYFRLERFHPIIHKTNNYFLGQLMFADYWMDAHFNSSYVEKAQVLRSSKLFTGVSKLSIKMLAMQVWHFEL